MENFTVQCDCTWRLGFQHSWRDFPQLRLGTLMSQFTQCGSVLWNLLTRTGHLASLDAALSRLSSAHLFFFFSALVPTVAGRNETRSSFQQFRPPASLKIGDSLGQLVATD